MKSALTLWANLEGARDDSSITLKYEITLNITFYFLIPTWSYILTSDISTMQRLSCKTCFSYKSGHQMRITWTNVQPSHWLKTVTLNALPLRQDTRGLGNTHDFVLGGQSYRPGWATAPVQNSVRCENNKADSICVQPHCLRVRWSPGIS